LLVKAPELAKGLKDILSGRLNVKISPNTINARFSNAKDEIAFKIGRLLEPSVGLENNMLNIYLSSLVEKLREGEILTPVEQQVVTAAVKIVDKFESFEGLETSENILEEESIVDLRAQYKVWQEKIRRLEQNSDILEYSTKYANGRYVIYEKTTGIELARDLTRERAEFKLKELKQDPTLAREEINNQISNKLGEIINKIRDSKVKSESLIDEEKFDECAPAEGDFVSTVKGFGEVIEHNGDYVVVELQHGVRETFPISEVEKTSDPNDDIEGKKLVDWFNRFNPDKFLKEQAKKNIKESPYDMPAHYDDWKTTSDDYFPDESIEKAVEYAQRSFNFNDFINGYGRDFGWGERSSLIPEDKIISKEEIINSIIHYLTSLANSYSESDASIDRVELAPIASEIFDNEIKSTLESEGYTFSVEENDDFLDDQQSIIGRNVQDDFKGQVRRGETNDPHELKRMRKLAGIED
jgi:hypothetical protein